VLSLTCWSRFDYVARHWSAFTVLSNPHTDRPYGSLTPYDRIGPPNRSKSELPTPGVSITPYRNTESTKSVYIFSTTCDREWSEANQTVLPHWVATAAVGGWSQQTHRVEPSRPLPASFSPPCNHAFPHNARGGKSPGFSPLQASFHRPSFVVAYFIPCHFHCHRLPWTRA
jgi:hypothetical protein